MLLVSLFLVALGVSAIFASSSSSMQSDAEETKINENDSVARICKAFSGIRDKCVDGDGKSNFGVLVERYMRSIFLKDSDESAASIFNCIFEREMTTICNAVREKERF